MELPPRARRILRTNRTSRLILGTTSACAENTVPQKCNLWGRRNYLRVRGEYRIDGSVVHDLLELPPRARRILAEGGVTGRDLGTTSACAENTLNELGLL